MSESPRIRPIDETDIEALVGLWLDFSREMAALDDYNELADGDLRGMQTKYRRDRLGDGDYQVFLAETDSAPVGYVTVEQRSSPPVFARGDELHVPEVYVREPRRGTGLADRLLDRAVAWGRERGCERVSLSVNVDNDRARGFYDRRGFEPRRLRLDRPLE
ncbi:MAG: N-acetyltransferase family protein [Haloglomus sp.]